MDLASAQTLGAAVNVAWGALRTKALAAGLTDEDLQPMCDALTAVHDAESLHHGQTIVPDVLPKT